VFNEGLDPVRALTARLVLQPDSFDFDTPQDKVLQADIPSGKSYSITWQVRPRVMHITRIAQIHVAVVFDNGDTLRCDDDLLVWIPTRLLSCYLSPSADILSFNPVTGQYPVNTVMVSHQLRNLSAIDATNLSARLIVTDPYKLLAFDPMFGDNSNPKTRPVLSPGGVWNATWGFRLRGPNTTGNYATVCFNVEYSSTIAGRAVDSMSSCSGCVMIAPAIMVGVDDNVSPASFQLLKTHPNPFSSSARIEYTVPSTGTVRLSVVNMLGRTVGVLVNGTREGGHHAEMLRPADMSPGVYLLRLEWNGLTRTGMVVHAP
jgi:hypothetical protein